VVHHRRGFVVFKSIQLVSSVGSCNGLLPRLSASPVAGAPDGVAVAAWCATESGAPEEGGGGGGGVDVVVGFMVATAVNVCFVLGSSKQKSKTKFDLILLRVRFD